MTVRCTFDGLVEFQFLQDDSHQSWAIRDLGVAVTTWPHYRGSQGSTSGTPERTHTGRSAFGNARPLHSSKT